ncbi:hypothetical protein GSI_09911 [Ganoderma sinense ZZ0214-1]|uniref:Enoyl reductase (ER) domain-containing protein n=1 Tax=Ganoderma sinense ZZ0214-1 TaxID=1077348 RepID=A0A2G8S2K0_9APHY|nr:hypothetical protein GSI_09911 [Ganoderma sinense ZZ0214-1]
MNFQLSGWMNPHSPVREVQIEYAGVDFLDIQQREGSFPLQGPLRPAGLGVEAAGTIVALPTDEAVLASEAFRKRRFHLGGKVAYSCLPLPPPLPPTQTKPRIRPGRSDVRLGAASLVHGLTALALAGDTVLVHALAGGLAQRRGEGGGRADHVILYRDEGVDVGERVLALTGGRGVHTIFDGIGRDTFATNLKAIRAKGTIVVLGTVATVYVNEPADGRDYREELVGLLGSGALKPLISKEYRFTAEGVMQAQKDLQSRSFGWEAPDQGDFRLGHPPARPHVDRLSSKNGIW